VDFTIERVEHFPADDLMTRLRRVTMLKRQEVFIYQHAEISLREMDTEVLFPAQSYVLIQEMQKVRRLKWELARLGYDLFRLEGYIKIWLEGEDSPIDLLPPVVEESVERNGRVVNIINDGMHRLYLAYLEWTIPQVVFVRDLPAGLPYYAFPNPTQWSGIKWVESLPEGFVKKWHRIADYKTLYRDFNSAFDNVGGPRGRFAKAAS
jgi:hypothetical protein